MNKIKEIIKNKDRLILGLMNHGYLNWIPDKPYLKKRFYLVMNSELNLDDPKTFNEKLQWLKLNDRKQIYTTMVDKYDAKGYISSKLGTDEYIVPTYGIFNSFDEIDFDNLPDKFVLKCTHNSGGGMIICNDKSKLDIATAKKNIKYSLKHSYVLEREWPYKNVKPRIIIEKYLGDNLIDYRLYTFNGKVQYIYQYINESKQDCSKPSASYCNIYDSKWIQQEFKQKSPSTKEKYKKPKQLSKMIEIAEKIAVNVPFLRVDFYIIDEKIYIGELTFYPGAGMSKFYPEYWDLKFGELLDLSLVEKNEK